MRRITLVAFALLLGALTGPLAHAEVSVRPFLIDQAVSPREIFTTEVNLSNTTDRKLNVYATVNEITVGVDGEVKEFVSPIMSDRTNTVTSWVEVTRGRIELEPGAETLVPITFRIHPQAEPGVYHAFIGFVPTSKRHQAEVVAMSGEADGVVVKLTIEEKVSETLRLKSFSVDRFVLNPAENTVTIAIENLGDVPTSPNGEVIFYRANGDEVAAVPVNTDGSIVIQPSEVVDLTVALPTETLIGRVKANAVLEYGKSRAALFDSTYFYMLPLPVVVGGLLLLITIMLGLIVLMFRSYRHSGDEGQENELPLYVRDGNDAKEMDHDINLKQPK